MKSRTTAAVVAIAFLLGVVQLVAGILNPWAAIAAGGAIALLAFGLFHFFEVEFQDEWAIPIVPILASLFAIAIVYLGGGTDPVIWLSPLAATVVCLAVLGLRRLGSRRCGLCNHRLGGDVAFNCPRCGLLVCEQTCWVFERCRCRLCEQNHVPVFSPDGRWWDKHFGPRSQYGRCQLCQATAAEADLRVCGRCGRPQCRDCWDFANGQCSRCQWTVSDLPEQLQSFLAAPSQPQT